MDNVNIISSTKKKKIIVFLYIYIYIVYSVVDCYRNLKDKKDQSGEALLSFE